MTTRTYSDPERDWESQQEYLRDQSLREPDDKLSPAEIRRLLRTREPDDIEDDVLP